MNKLNKWSSQYDGKPKCKIKCCECRFFTRDTIGSGDGIGSCDVYFLLDKITKNYPLYPNAERICDLFNPIDHISLGGSSGKELFHSK